MAISDIDTRGFDRDTIGRLALLSELFPAMPLSGVVIGADAMRRMSLPDVLPSDKPKAEPIQEIPAPYVKRSLADVRRDYEALVGAPNAATQRLIAAIQGRDGGRLETLQAAVADGANVNALIVYDRYDHTPYEETSGAAKDYLRSVGALSLKERRARIDALSAEYQELTGEPMPTSSSPARQKPPAPAKTEVMTYGI